MAALGAKSFSKYDSLQLLPVRRKDSLNNVEQISIDYPVAGNYKISVKGFNVSASSSQPYSIAYQFDTLKDLPGIIRQALTIFLMREPTSFAGDRLITIRRRNWRYSVDNGNSWQLIDDSVDLTTGYYKWTPPDSFVTAILRMNFASQHFSSDTFTISRRFDVNVGFNCDDSFMLYWNKISGVNSYQVYRLGDRYMEPLSITTDTATVLNRQASTSLHYAVAPLINNKTGVRSYAYDYTAQGVGCYIRTFFGEIVNSSSRLDLELGTNYHVKSITWERLTLNGYSSLQTVNSIQGLDFSYLDNAVTQGSNIYRVKIELLNARSFIAKPQRYFIPTIPSSFFLIQFHNIMM
jgi:hypothetical protein